MDQRKAAFESAPLPEVLQKIAAAEKSASGQVKKSRLEELIEGIGKSNNFHDFEKITLPSLGKFYDNFAPGGVIHVRELKGREEQVLGTQRFYKENKAIDKLIEHCIEEKNINPGKLLSLDRQYLLIYLRGISHGIEYATEVKCPECQQRFETTVDLDADLSVNQCKEDFGPQSLRGVLPKTGYKFSYHLSTGDDEILLQKYKDKRMKIMNSNTEDKQDENLDDTSTYKAALFIDEIEGLTDKKELKILIAELPMMDVNFIHNLLNDIPFGVNTEIELSCPFCLEEFEINLPMGMDFFYPSQKKGKSIQA